MNGDSPSGKAVGSGPTIRGFESLIPSQIEIFSKSTVELHGGFKFIKQFIYIHSPSF